MPSAEKILRDTQANVVALDAEEEPVALIVVRATRSMEPEVYEEIVEMLRERAERFSIPYFILADLSTVRIFRQGVTTPELEVPFEAVLSAYSSDDIQKRSAPMFPRYLEGRVGSWLRDVAYHWKSETPPYLAELRRIGLAARLARGTTIAKSTLAA
jgi:hypothetical protein